MKKANKRGGKRLTTAAHSSAPANLPTEVNRASTEFKQVYKTFPQLNAAVIQHFVLPMYNELEYISKFNPSLQMHVLSPYNANEHARVMMILKARQRVDRNGGSKTAYDREKKRLHEQIASLK